MAKQLNVNLAFNADTSKAKAQLQELISDLNKISTGFGLSKDLPLTKEILEAQHAAKQLGIALENAININTGKLDLTAFNQQLKNSGMTLDQYANKLTMLGTTGDQAFLKIAQSIVNTQAPLRRSNALLSEFATTLKNTARWQISSSVLHGFMGAVQSAYGYAKDLDKSLNNIRIVTQQNAEQMAAFAEQANKAAQALNTTTTQYTNASLIYYQQGLSDEEVLKRTDITVKMANAAGQSAEKVSDQLTAVWNNFYDGSKSLEYYADVMTALGAATASSTDEIAGGLEKFAAIADTIGLSYEYAASALATITSNTRQSEEVVGTALKTIFARIQGLNLGETLDDGTTLNKYSEALEKVGISIFNQAGELKNMDTILDDMGAKWNTLNTAQQTALAQTIAGVRQYTQLIALMENWDSGDSDSFQMNLMTSKNATGALQEQADIYAESWEASRDRVTAALESIYSSLLDKDFFIDLNDTLTAVIGGLGQFIDSAGGVKGVLLLLGSVVMRVFNTEISNGINNAIQNFRIFSGITQTETAQIKKAAHDMALSMTRDMDSFETTAMRQSLEKTYEAQDRLAKLAKTMSAEQLANAESALQVAQSYNEQAIAAGRAADAALKLREQQAANSRNTYGSGAVTRLNDLNDTAVGQADTALLATSRELITTAEQVGIATSEARNAMNAYAAALRTQASGQELTDASNALLDALSDITTAAPNATSAFSDFQKKVDAAATNVVTVASKFDTLKQALSAGNVDKNTIVTSIRDIQKEAKAAGLPVQNLGTALHDFFANTKGAAQGSKEYNDELNKLISVLTTTTFSVDQMNNAVVASADGPRNASQAFIDEANSARVAATANLSASNAIDQAAEASRLASQRISTATLAYQSLGSAISGGLQGITSFAMGLNSLSSIYDTLNNKDLSTFEKTTQIIMSLGMALPMLGSSIKSVTNLFKFMFSAQEKGLAVQMANLLNVKAEIAQDGFLVISKTGAVLSRHANAEAAEAEAAKIAGATTMTQYDTTATWANVAAKMAQYWWIGLIVLAVAALAVGIYAAVDAYNAEANAAKEAAEEAENMKKVYEETKKAAEELKSTIDDYNDSINAMEDLKKGTLAYKEALMEANEKALELLNTYDFLSQYMSRNNEGLIVISQEGLDEILDAQFKKVEQAQYTYMTSKLKASELKEKSDRLDFSRAQDLPLELTNNLLDEITAFFEDTDINSLIPDDLFKMEAFKNASEEQQNAILKNIDAYSQMGRQLKTTNDAQAILTEAYLDAAWKLNNPDVEPDEAGRYPTEAAISKSLFNTYTNRYYLNDKEREQARADYIDKKWDEFIGEDGFGWDDAFLLSGNMPNLNWGLTDYSSHGGYWSPSHMNGSDAQFYAKYRGYDDDVDSGFDWKHLGMGYYGPNTWTFKKDGTKVETLDGAELAQGIADIKTEIENAEKAKIEAPEILANVDQILANLPNNKNLANLMYSAEMNREGKGQFTMPDYYMSQEEAQKWLNSWESIASQFEGKMTDTGFWKKMGFESGDTFLSSLNTWLTDRSQINDAEAFKNSGVNIANMKTASDNVSAKVENGDLTSANADDDASYQNMVIYAKDLLQIYPELTEAASTFANAGLIGTQQWIEAYDILAAKINSLDAASQAAVTLQQLKEKTGKDYTAFFESLTPEQQTLFPKIDINKYQSEQALTLELQRLQKVAEQEKIEVKLTAIQSAQEGLSEDMSTEDWENLRDNTLTWGKDGIIEFNAFLNMSYEQQQQYLSNLANQTETELANSIQATIELLKTGLSALNDPTEVEAVNNTINALQQELDIYNKLEEAGLSAAESLAELQAMYHKALAEGENVNYTEYADNLIRLGEAYDNCAKEVEDYRRALANGDSVDEAEDALEASILLAEAAEEYGFQAKELEVQSRKLATAYNLTAAAAAKLAIQNQRMNKGIVTLAENWEKWNKALTDSDTTTTDFADAVIDCTAAVADLVGASADLELPDDFFNTERLALLEQAINGDINAINQLGFAVAETQIKALEFNAAFASLSQMMDPMGDTAYDEQSFDNDMQLIVDRLEALRTRTDQVSADMGQDWVDALNRMAKATGMSVDEMNQLLGTMGVQAKVKVDYVEQEMEIPTYTDHYENIQSNPAVKDEDGNIIRPATWSQRKYTVPGEPVKVTGYAAVAQISTEENPMEADIDEGAKPSGGSSGGGATWTGNRGSIAPSTAEKVKETKEKNAPKLKEAFEVDDDQFKSLDEEAERYHEINNELEVLADNLDSISKEKDRAYGANRVKLIDQETNALKKQLSVQERYIDEIEDYLEQDRAKMDKYGFMFNEDADIINYDQVMDQQIQAYNAAYQAYINAKNAAVATYNAAVQSGTSEEDAEKIYDAAIKAADATWEAAQERYETFEKELRQYEESVDLLRQQQQVLQDIKYQIQDLNYEKIQYKLEVKMEINDAEMRMLDYYLNKLSDDFYSMAEAAQLMIDKVPLMTTALGNYESFYHEIEAAYAAGDISQEAYVDGLKQSYDGILNNLEALNQLDKEMMHYYEDTLAAGQEELAHYTDRMEHLTSVLDHYHNLIVMINGEYDYDSIGTVLEGKASTIKNELEVASANYEMLLEQQALIQSHYDNAVDENARALHAEELKAINAQVDEAHELMLAKTEEWAEAQKAIMENTMAKAAREMEMAFTNNMGFDALSNSLNRLSATADVYLTETNKIYETQTLINKAQKDIDKTTNNAAKIRLKNYQEEIELLQDKNKLTKVELDIAKAKYDVLLAEIALEEAQNAKATVRLQRDSEGNYGYVYTADQQQVAEAEQTLLDTQNELYNIRLEAANEYGQKIMELNQQLADDLMALEQARVDGQFATEAEYQAAKEKIIAEYTELYKGYSASYAAATSEDARIEEEAWVTAYEGIINSADNWKNHIRIYTRECENAYSEYRSVVQSESDVINNLLGDVQGSVKDVTDESNNLKNKVINEVIPAIRNQYTQVAQVTAAYAAQRTGILNLIKTYEQLAASILKAMQAQANLNALEETPTGPTVPSTQTQEKPVDTKQPTEGPSEQEKARAKAIALEAQEIVTRVHTGAIPMHSSGRGWQPSAREQGYSEEAIKVALQAFNDSKPGAGWDYYYDIALQLASRYNTGGYTGAWGPYGKMAILDEKELVLNQRDTENFLMATDILRNIVDTIDFNSLHNQMAWLSSSGLAAANSGTLEQSVSIEAHFPNVSDRNEIEEAFNNLINTASQYANRKI